MWRERGRVGGREGGGRDGVRRGEKVDREGR